MFRTLIISCLGLILFAAFAFAADNSSGASDIVHGGGLTCFSLQPSDAPTNGAAGPRFPPQPPATYRSCDELCAAKHAACTATTSNMNPMRSCASNYYVPEATLCRCCAVAH